MELLDPRQTIGKRNVFDVAHVLNCATTFSVVAGAFMLHEDVAGAIIKMIIFMIVIWATYITSWPSMENCTRV